MGEHKKVLIVEDESILALSLKNRLEEAGYGVTDLCSSSTQVFRSIRASRPDIIVMDIQIEGSLDGIGTAKTLEPHGLPIIFLTAHPEKEFIHRAKYTKSYGFLTKPVRFEELIGLMELAFEKVELERKLRESERINRKLIENSPVGIGILRGCNLEMTNPAFSQLTGYGRELIGKSTEILYETSEEFERMGKHLYVGIDEHKVSETECRWKKKDGNIIDVRIKMSCLNHENVNDPLYIGIAEDISKSKRQERSLRTLLSNSIKSLGRAAEVFDNDIGDHTARIGEYCKKLSELAGLDETFQKDIQMQAQLHDIGKIHIPSSLLNKKGALSHEEFEIVKNHTIYGGLIIGNIPEFRMATQIAMYHHEKWDGSGYPDGLKGEEIPFAARITTIADVFDALVSSRSYKNAYEYDVVMDIIKDEHQTFDPSLLQIFLDNYHEFVHIHTANNCSDAWNDEEKLAVVALDSSHAILNVLALIYAEGLPLGNFQRFNRASDMWRVLNTHKVNPQLFYIGTDLEDSDNRQVSRRVKELYPGAVIACVTNRQDIGVNGVYDRIFRTPLEASKILEYSKLIWKYDPALGGNSIAGVINGSRPARERL